jgi:hypothetical protein
MAGEARPRAAVIVVGGSTMDVVVRHVSQVAQCDRRRQKGVATPTPLTALARRPPPPPLALGRARTPRVTHTK